MAAAAITYLKRYSHVPKGGKESYNMLRRTVIYNQVWSKNKKNASFEDAFSEESIHFCYKFLRF
jgi:hypothetical protein